MILEQDAFRLTRRLDELETQCIARFGPSSQARVFILVEQLVTVRLALLEAGDRGATSHLVARRQTLVRTIQELYNGCPFPTAPTPLVRQVHGDIELMEFDRATFEQRYARSAAQIQAEIVPIEQWRPRRHDRPVAYMYVVDDVWRLLVWSRPFRMADLVLGRNRATVAGTPIGHPMLVPERLRVRAAGELVPIFQDALCGIVANLKSGHFRPPPHAAIALLQAWECRVGLPRSSCDVLTVPAAPTLRAQASERSGAVS